MTTVLLAAEAQGGSALGSLVLFVPLILLFYFLLIRPQRRRMQDHARLVSSIEVGDEIETAGGIFGRIRRLEEDVVWLDVAEGTTLKVSRSAIRRRLAEPEPRS